MLKRFVLIAVLLVLASVLALKVLRHRMSLPLDVEETVLGTHEGLGKGELSHFDVCEDGTRVFTIRKTSEGNTVFANGDLLGIVDAGDVRNATSFGSDLYYSVRIRRLEDHLQTARVSHNVSESVLCRNGEKLHGPFVTGDASFGRGGRCAASVVENGKFRLLLDGVLSEEYDEILAAPDFSDDGKRVIFAARTGDDWFVTVDEERRGPFKFVGTWKEVSEDGKRWQKVIFAPCFLGPAQLPAFAWSNGRQYYVEIGDITSGPFDMCPMAADAIVTKDRVIVFGLDNGMWRLYDNGKLAFEAGRIADAILSPVGSPLVIVAEERERADSVITAADFTEDGFLKAPLISRYLQSSLQCYGVWSDGEQVGTTVDLPAFLSDGKSLIFTEPDMVPAFRVGDGRIRKVEQLSDPEWAWLSVSDQALLLQWFLASDIVPNDNMLKRSLRALVDTDEAEAAGEEKQNGVPLWAWYSTKLEELCYYDATSAGKYIAVGLRRTKPYAGIVFKGGLDLLWVSAHWGNLRPSYCDRNRVLELALADRIEFTALSGNRVLRCRFPGD